MIFSHYIFPVLFNVCVFYNYFPYALQIRVFRTYIFRYLIRNFFRRRKILDEEICFAMRKSSAGNPRYYTFQSVESNYCVEFVGLVYVTKYLNGFI